MSRRFLTSCVLVLVLGCAACRRAPARAKQDPHLDAGYALLLEAPERALVEFERSRDQGERKEFALGQAYEALGDLARAKGHYERALERRPGFVKAEAARGRIDLLQGNLAGARTRLAGVVSRAPEELPALLLYALVVDSPADVDRATAALRAWPERAKTKAPPAEYFLVLAALEQPGAGVAELRQAADLVRKAPIYSAPAALVLAELAVACQRPWLAKAILARLTLDKLRSEDATRVAALALELGEVELGARAAQAIQVFPEAPHSQLVLGQVALASGDAARALKHLRRAVALLPAEPARHRDEAEFLLAQALLRQKDLTAAAPLLDKLGQKDPKNLAVQLLSAELELEQKNAPLAVARLERALHQHPKEIAVHEHLARARFAAGDQAGAMDALRGVTSLTPSDVPALERLVSLYWAHGQAEAALAELEARTKQHPNDEELCLLLASAAERAKKPAILRATLERFSAAQPKSERVWLSLARLEEREQNKKAVQRALEATLTANPSSVPALTHLAEWSMRQKDWPGAAATYERLLAVAPEDTGALNNLGYLYADRLAQPERAVEVAERAHRLTENQPIIEDTLGWALLRRGQAEDRRRALSLLEHARELLPQEDVRLHLAVALHLTGSKEKARELLQGFRFRPGDPGHAFARSVLDEAG